MTLVKTSILTAISTIVRILAGFIINKVLAVYVGPSGLAIFGQFQNFVSIVSNFSNGAISQGIVKYTAEYKEPNKRAKLFSSGLIISISSSIFISLLLILFHNFWSKLVFGKAVYGSVFIVLGILLPLYSLNMLFLSILNGLKEIKKYILANIFSNISILIFTTILAIKFHTVGALYALVIGQSIIFFITFFLVYKSNWLKTEFFFKGVDKNTIKNLFKFSLMSITAAIMVPLSHITVRNYIAYKLGWDNAGYWQGIWYISSAYLMVVTTSLSVYYLPRLSEITDKDELKKEIINGYKIIMPIVIILASVIYVFKELIIVILFTERFMPMLELFRWQLIGDVIKIASWLLAYLMWAKAMTKLFIFTEIFFSVLWILLSIAFINIFGLIGVTYAFALGYFLYWIFFIFFIGRWHVRN